MVCVFEISESGFKREALNGFVAIALNVLLVQIFKVLVMQCCAPGGAEALRPATQRVPVRSYTQGRTPWLRGSLALHFVLVERGIIPTMRTEPQRTQDTMIPTIRTLPIQVLALPVSGWLARACGIDT